MSITIKRLTHVAELYCQYQSQSKQQPCYIELDCAASTLTAKFNCEIGNAIPFSVWHGHDRRYTIPCLTDRAANALMDEILPLCERVVAGYESKWDGSNNVAKFSDEARAAIEEIRELCADHGQYDEADCVNAWDASDWFSPDKPQISAETTDEEIEKLVTQYESELDSNVVVRDIRLYLETLRENAA